MRQLFALRDEISRRAAATPTGRVHDALAFEIGEIDLRLKEIWSGEESGVKSVALGLLPIAENRQNRVDRRGDRAGA